MIETASDTSSVTREHVEVGLAEILPSAEHGAAQPVEQPGPVVDVPISTTGNDVTFWVWTRVSASNSSSSVPKPPGRTTKPWEYFTNIVLRAKK